MIDDQRDDRAESGDAPDPLVDPGGGDPAWLWRDGGLVPWQEARVHVNAVGHASVAAVFEGLKAYLAADGERLLVFRLDDHLRRLHRSARICRVDIPWTVEELHTAVLEVLAANEYRCDVYVRPWAYPSGIIREQMVPAGSRCAVVVDSWPFRSGLGDARGCRAAVSSWLRIPDASAPPRAKAFSNYHSGRLALMEARENGHDWPIMLNERLKVSEGPAACVALVRDGTVVTPPLTGGLLESITRDTALALFAEAGVPVEVREVDRSELYVADELFFMGTAREILPVREVDGLTVGDSTPGPLTSLVRDAYMRLVRGESTGHGEWLTEVPPPNRA